MLSSSDICDSYQARAQTTVSRCVQVALLRLQDLWLSKIVTSGVIMPAGRIARGARYKDSTEVVGDLVVYLTYAIVTSGHLPLVMPLLWLSMLSVTLLAAASWHEQQLEQTLEKQSIASIVALPQGISALLHAASASANASAWALFSSICVGRMARVGWGRHGPLLNSSARQAK